MDTRGLRFANFTLAQQIIIDAVIRQSIEVHKLLDERADDHNAHAHAHRDEADIHVDIEHNLLARFVANPFSAGRGRNETGCEVAGR